MTKEQAVKLIIDHNGKIKVLNERVESVRMLHLENNSIAKGVRELAEKVAVMATEMKAFTRSTEANVDRLVAGQKIHGERLGEIEKEVVEIARNKIEMAALTAKVDTLINEPAEKWKGFVKHVTELLAAAVVGGLLSKFLI